MGVQSQLKVDFKTALKDKDRLRKGVITIVLSNIKSAEKEKQLKEKNTSVELNDDEVLSIISTELKQTKDSLTEYKKADRHDLVLQEQEKVAILESYLPKQLTEEEITMLAVELGIEKGSNLGKSIGLLRQKLGSSAEGKLITQVVKNIIS